MAAFAALLLIVAWNMSDLHSFVHILRVAPKSDVAVMLSCFGLTVVFDMVVAVTAGVVLAALLFIRRMAEISGASFSTGEHPALDRPLPPGVLLYEIAGPLFFGAAGKAMQALSTVSSNIKVLVIDVRAVPAMDVTGLVNLENALESLAERGTAVILSGVQSQPARVLERAGIFPAPGELEFVDDLPEALVLAEQLSAAAPSKS
jgi:SulP family sulfate permease